MEITHIGHSCFKIKGKTITLVVDPYEPSVGYKFPKQKADVLLISHAHPDHSNLSGVGDYRLVIDSPGEYETQGVFLTGFHTYHDEKGGKERGANTIYQIEIDGFTLLHLGDLGHELERDTLQKIGNIDVLMIPVGGYYTIDAETASKVISSIEPGIVIPMHYKTEELTGVDHIAPLKDFLEEMGVENDIKKSDRLKLTSRSDIPEDTEVYVLNMDH